MDHVIYTFDHNRTMILLEYTIAPYWKCLLWNYDVYLMQFVILFLPKGQQISSYILISHGSIHY